MTLAHKLLQQHKFLPSPLPHCINFKHTLVFFGYCKFLRFCDDVTLCGTECTTKRGEIMIIWIHITYRSTKIAGRERILYWKLCWYPRFIFILYHSSAYKIWVLYKILIGCIKVAVSTLLGLKLFIIIRNKFLSIVLSLKFPDWTWTF